MHIRRFEGSTMDDALARVKAELGPEALILSTRRVRRDASAFGWLAKPIVEVTAGIDREAVSRPSTPAPPGAETHEQRERIATRDPSWSSLTVTRALVDPLEREIQELRESVDRIAHSRETEAELRRSVDELRRALGELSRNRPPSGEAAPSHTDDLCARLEWRGLSGQNAFQIADETMRRRRNPEDTWRAARRTLASAIEARLVPARVEPGELRVFTGATGVGKTTSLAKIAGREIDSDEPSVIVTTDARRNGAEQQLRSLAFEIGAPFESAPSSRELAARLSGRRARRTLIDTAGRGRHDEGGLRELEAIQRVTGPATRFTIVASATTKESDLVQELERYRAFGADSFVITRSDETQDLSNFANLLLDERTPPLWFVGTGQRVPDDLIVPEPDWLAGEILGVSA